jgi:hypothetical protein
LLIQRNQVNKERLLFYQNFFSVSIDAPLSMGKPIWFPLWRRSVTKIILAPVTPSLAIKEQYP